MTDTPETRDGRTPPEAEREQDEAFLRRWSRRKREARKQAAAAPAPEAQPAAPPDKPEKDRPEKVLTDADMPPIESLNENSDFSLFLSAGVSEDLRRRALRKLFLLPAINQRCPLDGEYFDGRGFEPLGNVITHEMREEMERAASKLKESAKEALLEGGGEAPKDATARPATGNDKRVSAPASRSKLSQAKGPSPRQQARPRRVRREDSP